MAKEEWRAVEGYEGLYEASSLGHIRVVRTGLVKKPSVRPQGGYLLISLFRSGKPKTFSVHRLVAKAFLGPCPDGMECRHLNGNPADNRSSNLAYGTRKQNHADKRLHGTAQRGEKHNMASLTDAMVIEFRSRVRAGETVADISEQTGAKRHIVYNAVSGITWRHLPGALGRIGRKPRRRAST